MIGMPEIPAGPPQPEPDAKDWTWVMDAPCPECGFDPAALPRARIAADLLETADRWQEVLAAPRVDTRTEAGVWSPLEYACHCRDVYSLFGARARMMLDELDPMFENWDQDATAVEKRYWESDPVIVSTELEAASRSAAATFAAVGIPDWARPGRRGNGSVFTVESLGRYFVHDLVHHLHDVGARPLS